MRRTTEVGLGLGFASSLLVLSACAGVEGDTSRAPDYGASATSIPDSASSVRPGAVTACAPSGEWQLLSADVELRQLADQLGVSLERARSTFIGIADCGVDNKKPPHDTIQAGSLVMIGDLGELCLVQDVSQSDQSYKVKAACTANPMS